MTNKVDLILHPVRMRIITVMSGREMTTGELANALPDVAQATLYRHVNTLVEGDVLTVVDETPVRGTVEKRYTLNAQDDLNITDADLENATREDHIRYFTTFLVTLMSDYTRYLQSRSEINPAQDGVGYHTVPLYLNDEDVTTLGQQLQALLKPYQAPQSDRQRRLFSFVMMPSDNQEKA